MKLIYTTRKIVSTKDNYNNASVEVLHGKYGINRPVKPWPPSFPILVAVGQLEKIRVIW